jgi:hypothetical protein
MALQALDEVLAQGPRKDVQRLSVATRRPCAFGNHIVERHRQAGATRERPVRLNALLSVTLGCHFALVMCLGTSQTGRAHGFVISSLRRHQVDRPTPRAAPLWAAPFSYVIW